MRTIYRKSILIWMGLLATTLAVAADPVTWPDPVVAKIREILAVKNEAMSYRDMRTPKGKLGKRFEALLGELGGIVQDPALLAEIKLHEQDDLRAKIVLWALDRKKRPDEYQRFAKYYVNHPGYENIREYELRPLEKNQDPPDPFAEPPDVGLRPAKPIDANPVDPEDQVEKNRLILEYCFYAPPSGGGFARDTYRSNMLMALLSLGKPERTMVVIISDAEFALSTEVEHNPIVQAADLYSDPLGFLASAPTEQSFSSLSKFWKDERASDGLKRVFTAVLWKKQFSPVAYARARANYQSWQYLAKTKRDAVGDKGFAHWMLTQDPPVDGNAK